MKNKQIISPVLILISCFFIIKVSAEQVFTGYEADKLVKGSAEIRINETRKSISFVRMMENSFVAATSHGQWLSTVLNPRQDDVLRLYKTETDKYGFTHYRYRQYYKNIPVEYSMYLVHTKDGRIISVNGEFYSGITTSTQPLISSSAAVVAAKKYIDAEIYKSDQNTIASPELVILRVDDGSYKLVYKTDVYAEKPLSRNWIYVDASNGKILKKTNRIETIDVSSTAVTHYSGTKGIRVDSLSASSFRLRESVRGAGNGTITRNLQNGFNYPTATDFTRTTNTWPYSYDNAALDAHFGAEKTYDHYYNNYGRNSFDGLGGTILSYVHYDVNYVNAFWDGTEMTYGDGDGVQYSPLTSLEIVGHEITHGVTEHSANLVYSGESGALNESFSDIMGNTIRFIYDSAFATWYCGDQIVIAGSGATPFRNLSDPNQFQCADTYGGLWWNNGDIVHYDSGVQNFWYYLLTTGGTGVNDNGASYTVNGIGLTDANAIAFRNLTNYLTPNSTFADARTYAIQSAIDLFGNCSNQVIQTANAWHAVGVGGVFSNAVVASFNATQNYFCITPATVYFTNNSFNATSYSWNFGDGGTSTLTSPFHVYTAPGTYTVTLIATGTAACGNSDTLTLTNYIIVTNTGGPISPSCTPSTVANCCGIGITRVQLNTINNTSGNASEGYRDFTCSNATTLTAGDSYLLTVTTGFNNSENVKAWIDYNNNGFMNPANELVFTSTNHTLTHAGVIHTPVTAVLNTPLRMRVMDDNATYTISSSCYNPQNGQAEDYTVTFIANTLPPVANFIASDTVVNVGSTILFNDLSIHAPTSWQWSFPGSSTPSSFVQNPSVVYNTLGDYTVTLLVSNSFGADSMVRTLYIHVVNSINMCSATTTSAANGQLYDSGGPTGPYQNYENCSLLISPVCASSITLTFTSFQTEGGFDYLYVYDGPDALSPLILTANGTMLPNAVTATSGQMFIAFYSDGSVTYPGFAANWTSVIVSSSPPVADFSIGDTTPPLNTPVQFTDQSTNSPVAWNWNFGDGNFSSSQNPTHAYLLPGLYTVTLIAYTCNQSDTISKSLTVQIAPQVIVDPDTLNATVACGGTITIPLTVYNTGGGDLVYSTSGTSNGPVKVLAFTYGSDTTQEYPNTLLAMNQYFTNYILTRYSGTDAVTLQAALTGKDVLLFPEHENSLATVYTPLATVVQNFVSAGGIVVMCGSGTPYANRIFDLGLFSGSFGNYSPSSLTTLDTTDAITNNVPITFAPPNATFYMYFTNSDKVKLVEYTGAGADVVAYRHIGSGTVIYLGFDYYAYNNATAQLVANSVSLPNTMHAPWISPNPASDTVVAGDSSVIQVTFSTYGLYAGVHTSTLILNTNDPLHPTVTVVCSLTVTGSPSIGLSQSCLNFGSVMEHTVAVDTIYIRNNGCDTLHVTSIIPPLAEYTCIPSANIPVPPYDSSMVIVHFAPNTVGTFNGNLVIHDNDVDTIICLTGSSVAAPIISTIPTSFNVNLNACSDSVTLPLYIYNTGGSNLNYTISGGGVAGGMAQVLALTYGTDLTTEYPNTIAAINQYFTNYNLDTIYTTSPSALQAALVGKDIFLMTEPENGTPSVYAGFPTVLQNFVANGGTAILCGSYDLQSMCIFNTGLFSGTFGIDAYTNPVNVVNTSTPITNGVSSSFTGSNGTYCLNITNADKIKLIDYTGMDVVSYRNIGSGKAIYIAFDYFSYVNDEALIVSNAMQWAATNQLSSWIHLSSSNGTVTPGDSNLVNVTFSSVGLAGGVYHGNIIIHSNDPLNPNDTIPCTLNVTFNPCADFSFTTSICSGIVNFTSNTINNPTSYIWSFGDGGTDTAANPSHTYAATGVYTVQLIACNAFGCDTISKTVSITVTGGPVAASCSPVTTAYCCGIGIYHVTFNTINNTSSDGVDGYMDYTCTSSTSVVRGTSYTISVETGPTYTENVKAWIDYNNNGVLESTESVFTSLTTLQYHTGSVYIPSTGIVLNTPLRMRVGSDWSGNAVPDPCIPIQYGQFEDYTVVITTGIGVPSIINTQEFSIYPNPFTGETFIEYNITNAKKVTLEVYNAIGEKISVMLSNQLQQAGKYIYTLKSAEAGIYFVKLTTDDGTLIRRIVCLD